MTPSRSPHGPFLDTTSGRLALSQNAHHQAASLLLAKLWAARPGLGNVSLQPLSSCSHSLPWHPFDVRGAPPRTISAGGGVSYLGGPSWRRSIPFPFLPLPSSSGSPSTRRAHLGFWSGLGGTTPPPPNGRATTRDKNSHCQALSEAQVTRPAMSANGFSSEEPGAKLQRHANSAIVCGTACSSCCSSAPASPPPPKKRQRGATLQLSCGRGSRNKQLGC
jgi:hypothetical protein